MPDGDNGSAARVALARLDQVDRQLNRLEDDLNGLDTKLDGLLQSLGGLSNRVTALETWKTDVGSVQQSNRDWVSIVISAAAVLVAVIALAGR